MTASARRRLKCVAGPPLRRANAVNNIPFAAALHNPAINAFAAAITDVVARHEIRTVSRDRRRATRSSSPAVRCRCGAPPSDAAWLRAEPKQRARLLSFD